MYYLENMLIGESMPSAILLMNTNKSSRNISKKAEKVRERCLFQGINLEHDVVVSKGVNRDIDRPAINTSLSLLLTKRYQVIIVDKRKDITTDIYDLETFLDDAADAGVKVFELSSMQYKRYVGAIDKFLFEIFGEC